MTDEIDAEAPRAKFSFNVPLPRPWIGLSTILCTLYSVVNKAASILEPRVLVGIMAARSDVVALTASALATKTRLLLVS